MGLNYKATKLDILITSLVCRWKVFQNWVIFDDEVEKKIQ